MRYDVTLPLTEDGRQSVSYHHKQFIAGARFALRRIIGQFLPQPPTQMTKKQALYAGCYRHQKATK